MRPKGRGMRKCKGNFGIRALAMMGLLSCSLAATSAATNDGIAVAIVYDTSGSMKQSVRDAKGKSTAKYVIANRALESIARQIEKFSTNSSQATKPIHAGLWTFDGNGVREAIKFGPFDPERFVKWARGFSSPGSGTPLGNALNTAAQGLTKSSFTKKHILLITDGVNTVGPEPSTVLQRLKQRRDFAANVHFVAFDIDGKLFDPVKKLGVMVAEASDEKQLNTQLDYILTQKILLEDEEPQPTKK